jgi:hypothetical protein
VTRRTERGKAINMAGKNINPRSCRASRRPHPGGRGQVATLEAPILVPLGQDDPSAFMVFGDGWDPSLGDLQPWPTEQPFALRDVISENSALAGIGNAGIQALNGYQQAQGLVRLAPETMAALKMGATPLQSGGWNLGSLTTAGTGRIASQVRWLPAGGATVLSSLAALGPAITMVFIQMQLSEITRLVKVVIDLQNDMLRYTRNDVWAEVHSAVVRLGRLGEQARDLGFVGHATIDEARGKYDSLSHRREHMVRNITDYLTSIRGLATTKSRRDWLNRNAQVVLNEIQTLVLASQGCYVYEVLRAAERSQNGDALHAEIIMRDAHTERARDRDLINDVVTRFVRALELIAACPGNDMLAIGPRKRPAKDAAAAARHLVQAISSIGFSVEEPLVAQTVRAIPGHEAIDAPVLAAVRWHMEPGERLTGATRMPRSVLLATDRRLIACRKSAVADVTWQANADALALEDVYQDWDDWNIKLHDSAADKNVSFEVGPNGRFNRARARDDAEKVLEWVQSGATTNTATLAA